MVLERGWEPRVGKWRLGRAEGEMVDWDKRDVEEEMGTVDVERNGEGEPSC